MFHVSHFSSNPPSFTTPFPAVHSILAPTALAAEILPRYDFGNLVNCIFLARGVNDTYLVQAGTEKYILRVYTAGMRSITDILYEIDILLHRERNGVPVITFFDFDFCGMGWRAYDLAIVRWSEGFYNMDPDDTLWQAFLKGYKEERHIAEIDLASIPAFVALRELWHMALITSLQFSSGMQDFDRLTQRTVNLLGEWEKSQFKL